MEPKIGDKMKVSPQLTAQPDWIDGEVIDVEHNPFTGLVISIKDYAASLYSEDPVYHCTIIPIDCCPKCGRTLI